jgi:hypothetical protein
VFLSERDLLRRESECCRKEKTETSNNYVRPQCEKKDDPVWQSKETSLRNERIQLGR